MNVLPLILQRVLWAVLAIFLPALLLAEDGSCLAKTETAADAPFDLEDETLIKGSVNSSTPSLKEIFSRQYHPEGNEAFAKHVTDAYKDQDLNPKTTVYTWKARSKPKETEKREIKDESDKDGIVEKIAKGVSLVTENILWILVAILLLLLVRYHHVWLPWVKRIKTDHSSDNIEEHAVAMPETLPDDLPTAVRTLWQKGQPRAAVALFYRASVKHLMETLDTLLPPGSTEAECLRLARRSPDTAYSKLFSRIVLIWQEAAYAERLPKPEVLEVLLKEWVKRSRPG